MLIKNQRNETVIICKQNQSTTTTIVQSSYMHMPVYGIVYTRRMQILGRYKQLHVHHHTNNKNNDCKIKR